MQVSSVVQILLIRHSKKYLMLETTSLPIATTQKRMLAFVIDDIVVVLLLLSIFYDQLMVIASHMPTVLTEEALNTFQEEINQFSADNLLIVVSLKVLYHTIFVWQNGMTLGKYIMKIKVIELDTLHTPTLLKALFRALLRIGSEVVFYLGFLLAFFSPLKQTLHDKLTNCVVIDA